MGTYVGKIKNSSYTIPALLAAIITLTILIVVPRPKFMNTTIDTHIVTIIDIDTLSYKNPKTNNIHNEFKNWSYGMDQKIFDELYGAKSFHSSLDQETVHKIIRSKYMMKELNDLRPTQKGSLLKSNFSTGFNAKTESESILLLHEINKIIKSEIISLKGEDPLLKFELKIIQYLKGEQLIRKWQTLWLSKREATKEERIEIIQLLKRLYHFSAKRDTKEQKIILRSLEKIFSLMPKEYKKLISVL